MEDDPAMARMVADPKHRRVLITDGRNPWRCLWPPRYVKAGASTIYVGVAERWKPFDAQKPLEAIGNVKIVDLDLTDERSVQDLAADLGGKVEILVNTADHVRPAPLFQLRRREYGAGCDGSHAHRPDAPCPDVRAQSCGCAAPMAMPARSPGSMCSRCMRSATRRSLGFIRWRMRPACRCRSGCAQNFGRAACG